MLDILKPEAQRRLAGLLAHAQKGESEYTWLHKLVLKAGYAKVEGREARDLVLVTSRSLATGFRVNNRTVKRWLKDGMPVFRESYGNRPALYDVFEVVRWRETRERTRLGVDMVDGVDLGAGGKDKWLTEMRKETARKIRRENEIAEGRLVLASNIGIKLAEVAQVFRTRAESIVRLHGEVVGKAIRQMIAEAKEGWERAIPRPKSEPVKPPGSPMRKRGETDEPQISQKKKRKPKSKVKPQISQITRKKKPKTGKKPVGKREKAVKKKEPIKKKKPRAKRSGSPMRKRGEIDKKKRKPTKQIAKKLKAPQPAEKKKRAGRRPAPRRGIIRTRY